MADHSVTLTYLGATFTADPNPVLVKNGETISFSLNAPPNTTFRVTMTQPEFFSAAVVNNLNNRVTLVKTLSGPTPFHCQLLGPDGVVVFESTETQPGGVVRPG